MNDCICRNNSARELSAFAESAMAVNRVVLQHMSLNMLEEVEPYLPVSNSFYVNEDSNMPSFNETKQDEFSSKSSTSPDVLSREHIR